MFIFFIGLYETYTKLDFINLYIPTSHFHLAQLHARHASGYKLSKFLVLPLQFQFTITCLRQMFYTLFFRVSSCFCPLKVDYLHSVTSHYL